MVGKTKITGSEKVLRMKGYDGPTDARNKQQDHAVICTVHSIESTKKKQRPSLFLKRLVQSFQNRKLIFFDVLEGVSLLYLKITCSWSWVCLCSNAHRHCFFFVDTVMRSRFKSGGYDWPRSVLVLVLLDWRDQNFVAYLRMRLILDFLKCCTEVAQFQPMRSA